MATNVRVWRIEATDPPVEGRKWSKNVHKLVLASTLEDALTIFRTSYPDTLIWKIMIISAEGEVLS